MSAMASMAGGSSANGAGSSLRKEVLEIAMRELERTLEDVESVSGILDLDAVRLQRDAVCGNGVDKAALRVPQSGVVKLAEDAGECLRHWRAKREEELRTRHEASVRRLRQSVKDRKEEQRDREGVRQEVRRCLFDQARWALVLSNDRYRALAPPSLAEAGSASASRPGAAEADEESIGAEALAQLKSRLDLVLSPVEALRADCPSGMLDTSELLSELLGRKRQRAPMLRRRLLDATGHLDAQLLQEADSAAAVRKAALEDQTERHTAIVRMLRRTFMERNAMFEGLDAMVASGGPQVDRSAWRALWPSDSPKLASISKQHGDISKDSVMRKFHSRAEQHVQELLHEFKSKRLQSTLSPQALDVEIELEIWKLNTAEELVHKIKSSAQAVHQELMQFLRAAFSNTEQTPLEQLGDAIAAAEAYQAARAGSLAEQCRAAESALAEFCAENIERTRSMRRRQEQTNVQRLRAFKEESQAEVEQAEAAALADIAGVAHRCISDAHRALQLPSSLRELGPLRPPDIVATLALSWDAQSVPVAERLDFIAAGLEALPETPETCAVARGMLCLLDNEFSKRIRKLRSKAGLPDSRPGSPR